jgi:hypothetical protein
MANLTILKKTRRQAAVKITGTGLANVTYTDIAYADQAAPLNTAGNLIWTISDIAYDVGNSANIKRGGNLVFAMNAGSGEFNLTDSIGVVLDEQSNANVSVNLGAIEGTVIIQFSKGEGFNDPNRQNQGPGSL